MDSKIIWDLKDSLSQYNTHIIDGEVCYGGCVEDNPIGIGFYRDFKRIKWVIPFNYENVIEGICVKKNDDGTVDYVIAFDDDTRPINIRAYNRKGLKTIPIDEITGNGLATVLTEEIVDDNFSYLKVNDKNVAVVALDLFKLVLDNVQREKLTEIIEDAEEKSIIKQVDGNLTLCCVFNFEDNTFRFERLNIKDFAGDSPQKIKISRQIHSNNKISNYATKIVKQKKENDGKIALIDEIIKVFPKKCEKYGMSISQNE